MMRAFNLSTTTLVIIFAAIFSFNSCEKSDALDINTDGELRIYQSDKQPIILTESCFSPIQSR